MLQVGDKVRYNVDWFFINKSGKVDGISKIYVERDKDKIVTITHIIEGNQYPYRTSETIANSSRFYKEELIKVDD